MSNPIELIHDDLIDERARLERGALALDKAIRRFGEGPAFMTRARFRMLVDQIRMIDETLIPVFRMREDS